MADTHCTQCNEPTIIEYTTCLCNIKMHYECLYPYKSLPKPWVSSNPVKKNVTSLIESSSFQFICNNCSNLKKPSPTPKSPLPPIVSPLNDINTITELITNINCRLDKQDKILTNITELLKTTHYNSQTRTHFPATNTTTYQAHPHISHSHPTQTTASSSSSRHRIQPNTTAKAPPLLKNDFVLSNSIVIEHLTPSQSTKVFLNEFLSYIHISPDTILSYKIAKSIAIIIFKSNQCYQAFISNLCNTRNNLRYSNLYFRKERTYSEMTRGRIIYHAYKEHLIPSNVKCTFNNKTNIFELRPTLNNSIKIDWNSEAIHISELNFNKWKLSYEHYLKTPNPHHTPSLPPTLPPTPPPLHNTPTTSTSTLNTST